MVAARAAAQRLPRAFETRHPDPPDLDQLAVCWQRALDAGELALRAAVDTLPASYLSDRRRELSQERQQTAELLKSVARMTGARQPWLSRVPVSKRMIGLPASIQACLFDLDGVLTDSAQLHAAAWAQVLDEFLLRLTASAGWHFIPFDRNADYRTYIDGRSRLEGIHAFLESRGIRLSEGRVDDPPDADTAQGLAKRKGEALARSLRQRGVTALPGVRRYVDAAGRAGLVRAVISASASTLPMLELAGLAGLMEVRMDASVIDGEVIRTAPAPDLVLSACRRLGVSPCDAVTFTHSPAGVVAGRAAGLAVVGVAEGSTADLLRDFGAERVVPSLSSLLD
ncbi:MAG: HAD hydrolase-like protein, partial [Chloroflexota bacterium]|nr:HAD hydrolase-like protein [Chloroflexota bacterium]